MQKIESKEYKQIALDMLIAFAEFCEENNLRYILDYGTLLGCIRHKGYIPWDDDIDISMPREDIDKALKILKEKDYTIKGSIKLGDTHNKYSTHTFFNKIVNIDTVAEDKLRLEKYRYPIWIDIFPFDRVPNDKDLIKEYKTYYDKKVATAMYPLFPHKNQNIIKKIVSRMSAPLTDVFLNKIQNKIRTLKKMENANYYYEFTVALKDAEYWGSKEKTFIYDESLFNDYVYKTFEGHKFRIPKDYDKRLTDEYGDYMKLPSKDKQIPHTTGAYWVNKG